LYRIERGSFSRFICDSDLNPCQTSKLLKDKVLTYIALEQLGISVPSGTYFLLGSQDYADSRNDLYSFLERTPKPLVIKPNNSSLGKGITILRTYNQKRVERAIASANKYSDVVIVQEYLTGEEFRIIAIEGEIVIALQKYPKPRAPEEVSLSSTECFRLMVRESMADLGATVCGYDLIVDCESTKVLEINSNPFVVPIKPYLVDATVERYFIRLEALLRRSNGN